MDIFGTSVLNRVVENMNPPSSFMLDTFFPNVQTEQSEEIHFDTDSSKPEIAPFVSPLVAGKVMEDEGFKTNSFKPAYVKDKRRFDVTSPLRRWAGEKIGGTMDPMERRRRQLARALKFQLERLTRREEVMAEELMRTGKVTVKGDKYPTRVVDFERNAGNAMVLAPGSQWGEAGVSIRDSLEAFVDQIQTESGGVVRKIVMDPKAAGLLRSDEALMKLMDLRRQGGPENQGVLLGPMQQRRQGRFFGTYGDFEFWVYQQQYVNEAKATVQLLPDYSVYGATEDAEGTRCYGAILDEEANYQAERYFSKSWLEKDPAVRWLLLQSAPLTAFYRPNGSGYMKVKT